LVIFFGGGIYVLRTAETYTTIPEGIAIIALLLWGCLIEVVRWRYTPSLATLRILKDGEQAQFPLLEAEEWAKREKAELAEIAKDFERTDSELEELEHGAEWVCSACGETNPRGFQICWKCETAKPEQSS